MPVFLLLEPVDSAFRTVDVDADLLKVATEALTVIQREGLNSMQNMLSGIQQFFSDLASQKICPSDGHLIELRAANCFKYVDKLHETRVEFLSLAAKADLRQLRIQTADILVMSCSRFVDQEELYHDRGLPQKLRARLEATLGSGTHSLTTNLRWLSLFGNSKHQIFEAGVSFRSRRSRHPRRIRREVRETEASADEEFMNESNEDIAVRETETQHLMGL